MARRVTAVLTTGAIVLWLCSLAVPALSFRFDGERDQILFGYQVLTSGFFHLIVLELSWLANFVFWFLAWKLIMRLGKVRTLIISAGLLILLAAQSTTLFVWDRFFQFPQPFAGYFLWMAANLLMGVAALIQANALLKRPSAT